MNSVIITPPTAEPVPLNVVKQHLRLDDDFTADDALLAGLLQAAREETENYLNRALITRTLDVKLDGFPDWELRLPMAPLQGVTYIRYADTAGDTQTLATSEYLVDTASQPGRLTPGYGKSWPSTREIINAVTLRITAGYGDDWNSVPQPIRQAMLMMIAHWYENRESVAVGNGLTVNEMPQASQMLLWRYKMVQF